MLLLQCCVSLHFDGWMDSILTDAILRNEEGVLISTGLQSYLPFQLVSILARLRVARALQVDLNKRYMPDVAESKKEQRSLASIPTFPPPYFHSRLETRTVDYTSSAQAPSGECLPLHLLSLSPRSPAHRSDLSRACVRSESHYRPFNQVRRGGAASPSC